MMASSLPKIQLPIFETVLPSTGETIKFRQYNVREEKIFLTAMESDDPKQIRIALRQVIGNCLIDVDVDSLALFDIEHLLMKIRAVSVNNIMTFYITDDDDEQQQIEIEIDANDVHVTMPEKNNKLIKLNEDTTLLMRYPSWQNMDIETETETELLSKYLILCIESVITGDEVINVKDVTIEELEGFFDELSSDMVSKIENFFNNMPTLVHTVKYTNKGGVEKEYTFEGINSFFL